MTLTFTYYCHLIHTFHSNFNDYPSDIAYNKRIQSRIMYGVYFSCIFSLFQSGKFCQSFLDFHDFETLKEPCSFLNGTAVIYQNDGILGKVEFSEFSRIFGQRRANITLIPADTKYHHGLYQNGATYEPIDEWSPDLSSS